MINSNYLVKRRNPISYSIWAMPVGKESNILKNTINLFSADFGGPIFEPHVSLVSSFLGSEKVLLQKVKTISKKIKPFDIYFDGIAYLDEFFRSIFFKVKVNTGLQLAIDITSKDLNWNDKDCLPHLSLAYGDYTKKEKEKMISTIKIIPKGFFVDHIFLVHNDEINLNWEIINAFPLSNYP